MGQWAIGHVTTEATIVQTIPQNTPLYLALIEGFKEGWWISITHTHTRVIWEWVRCLWLCAFLVLQLSLPRRSRREPQPDKLVRTSPEGQSESDRGEETRFYSFFSIHNSANGHVKIDKRFFLFFCIAHHRWTRQHRSSMSCTATLGAPSNCVRFAQRGIKILASNRVAISCAKHASQAGRYEKLW